MLIPEDAVKALISIGLSPNQAKIFLTNYALGKTTANEISTNLEIARETVYRILPSLENLGLITKHMTKPNNYEAIQPKEAAELLLLKRKKEYFDFLKKKEEIINQLSDFSHFKLKEIEKEDDISFVSPHEDPTQMAVKLIKNLRQSFWYTNTAKLFQYNMSAVDRFCVLKEINKALKRGVKIRVLVENPEGRNILRFSNKLAKEVFENPNYEVRSTLLRIRSVALFDDSCLIETSTKDDVIVSPFIMSKNPVLVELCQVYIEGLWEKSRELIK